MYLAVRHFHVTYSSYNSNVTNVKKKRNPLNMSSYKGGLCCVQERLEALMKRSLERSLQLEQRTKRWNRGCPAGAGQS